MFGDINSALLSRVAAAFRLTFFQVFSPKNSCTFECFYRYWNCAKMLQNWGKSLKFTNKHVFFKYLKFSGDLSDLDKTVKKRIGGGDDWLSLNFDATWTNRTRSPSILFVWNFVSRSNFSPATILRQFEMTLVPISRTFLRSLQRSDPIQSKKSKYFRFFQNLTWAIRHLVLAEDKPTVKYSLPRWQKIKEIR